MKHSPLVSLIPLALFTPLWLLACGTGAASDSETELEDPAEHACEHSTEAGTDISAAAAREQAPLLALSEEPYNVAIPQDGTGWVAFEGPAEALLFLSHENVATRLFAGGSDSDLLSEGAANELCPDEIPEHFDLDLESGPYVVQLGPTALQSVWLMFLSAEGHAHEE